MPGLSLSEKEYQGRGSPLPCGYLPKDSIKAGYYTSASLFILVSPQKAEYNI
jgi:hypothetical protein